MTAFALVLSLLDGSGDSSTESPLVAFTVVTRPGAEGRARAGVLDSRTGRLLWSVSFEGGVNDAWPSVHGDVLAVLVHSRKGGYECHAFTFETGRPRFRAEGSWCLDLSGGGRRLLGIAGSERLAAVDPVTGHEAWTAPVTRHCRLATAPAQGFLVAQGPRHLSAYSLEDGRRAWERAAEEPLVPSGGRLWILKRGEPRLVELDALTGGEKTALDLSSPLVAIVPQRAFVDLVLEHEAVRLRGRDLAPEWRTPLPAAALSAAGDARTTALSVAEDRILLLDAPTGRLLRDESAERFSSRETSLANPGWLLQSARTQDGRTMLWIYDRRDGRISWKESVEEYERGGSRDTILLQRERRLLLLEPGTRSERWSRALDGAWKATARRGDLVLAATERSIAGIQAASGHETWRLDLEPAAGEVRFSAPPVPR